MSMTRLMQSLAFVIGCTLLGWLLGGWVGREVGRSSPAFVSALAKESSPKAPLPPEFRPAEFGHGLGMVCGLFLGSGTGVALVVVHALRDAWLQRLRLMKDLRDGAGVA